MFGSVGMPELIVIFVIALIVFGPRRLPEMGKSLGKAISEFKKATSDLQSRLEEEVNAEATAGAPPAPQHEAERPSSADPVSKDREKAS